MKRIIIFMAAMCCLKASNAQVKKNTNTPTEVTSTFSKEYPTATKVKWEKEHGNFEVSFASGDKKMSVVYKSNGSKVETETSIAVDKLPPTARKYAESRGKIKDAAEIVKADGSIVYEAEVNGKDLIFDRNGKFLKEVKD